MTRIVAQGGWTIRVQCDGCHRFGDQDEVRRRWLSPVFVRMPDRAGGTVWLQTALCPRCAIWRPTYWIKVVLRLRIGRVSDWLAPGYGACFRCRTNWHFCDGHTTPLDECSGMFPLCELCWGELTPLARLPFYRALFDVWEDDGHERHAWPEIEAAVLLEGASG